jgi:hypothetical protein
MEVKVRGIFVDKHNHGVINDAAASGQFAMNAPPQGGSFREMLAKEAVNCRSAQPNDRNRRRAGRRKQHGK